MQMDDKGILYFMWIATTISLFVLIPKAKVGLALVAFLFAQALTWPMGLFTVDMGWIQYPIRFFENANYASFTFDYFFLPVMCVYFNIYFPEGKGLLRRTAHYTIFCTAMALLELLFLHHTNLIRYIHWNAYWTWITLWVNFYITRKFCLWFFMPYNKA